jgi:hypothetical protein
MFLFTRTHKLGMAEMPGSLFKNMTKEQAGLTVVELLIAATILVFVLAGAYTFFSFGWSSFDRGTDRAVVQNNLRMAAEAITKEVRFAEGISIIDTSDIPDPVDDDDIYIFINNDSRIERKDKYESRIIPHELDSNVFLELDFERSSSNVLKVVITETRSNMTLETEIRILNGSIVNNNSIGNALIIGSNGSGGSPGTIPVISNMIIDPGQHFAGSAQIVNVTINTQNVNDNTVITLDFLDTDSTSVLYSSNVIINNDSASTLLNLPESLSAGSYYLRASEVNIPNDYYANYTINNVINTLAFSNTDNPPNTTVNSSYAGHTFSATGGVTPYSYNITAGSLPTGMSMNAGMLEGTPTVDGTYNFTVTVNDSSNPMESASHDFTLVVSPATNGDNGDNGDDGDPGWEPNDEFPAWENKVYNSGLKVSYNGNRYISRQYINANTGNPDTNGLWILQPLPNEDYPRWRSIEPYSGSSRVIHENKVYRAKWWANAGVEPPSSPWELEN